MRRLVLIVLLALPQPVAAQLGTPATDMDTVHTAIDLGVAQLLDVIQRKVLDREHPLCLLGRVTADSTIIAGIASATVSDKSEPLAVAFDCPEDARFIGVAHNHPPGSIGCGVSVTDMVIFLASPRIQVSAHTCSQDGETVIVVRRRDRHDPVVIGYRP